jgi:uncharacterized cupredoxin-like copper-binding protein
MRQSVLALALAGGISLLASGASFAQTGVAPLDYMSNSADIVKAAKWDQMETVTIELTEHDFKPKQLKLKANQPYRLVIKNTGEFDHYYTAAEFFKSVAWRKVQTPRPHGGEVKAPYFTAVEAYKNGGTVELFIVPVKKGTYEVVCTIDGHVDKGMTGSITVE